MKFAWSDLKMSH